MLPDFRIGAINDFFQYSGKTPVEREKLNRYCKGLAIILRHIFKNNGGIPTGPALALSLSEPKKSIISFSDKIQMFKKKMLRVRIGQII